MATKFHLALPCVNVSKTKAFYVDILGATMGRSAVKWADVNLFNNQITFTECGPFKFDCKNYSLMGTSCLPFILGSYWKKGIGNKSINDLSLRGTRSFPKLNFLKTRLVSIGHFLSKTQMISWWSLNVLQIQMKFLKVDLVVFSL